MDEYARRRMRRRPNRVFVNNSPERTYDLIRARLHAMRPGERLVEDELVESLSASRQTMRAVLQRLADEGLVVRRPKVGTMPIESVIFFFGDDPATLDEACVDDPDLIHGRVLRTSLVDAPPAIQAVFGHRHPAPVTMVEEVMLYRDLPFATSTMYIDVAMATVPEPGDLLPGKMSYLEELLGVQLVASRNTLGAGPCDPGTATLLDVAEGSPVLWRESLLQDAEGTVRTICQMRYRSDRVTFVGRNRSL